MREMQLENTYVEATLIYLSIHTSRGDLTLDLMHPAVVAEKSGEHCFIPGVRTGYG